MFKKGYKIILIKDGEFNLKQFHLNYLTGSILLSIIVVPFLLFIVYFSFNMNSGMNNLQTENDKLKDELSHKNNLEDQVDKNHETLNKLNNQLINNRNRSDQIVKTLFKVDPMPKETRKAGSGGNIDDKKNNLNSDNSNLNTLYDKSGITNHQIKKLQKQINIESIYLSNIEHRFYDNIKYWASLPSRMPMDIERGIYISSYYGFREDPMHDKKQFHSGDDFSAKPGTPVKCTANGLVIKAEFNHRLGNFVEISHGYGYKTVYAHMENGLSVQKGDKVFRGQTIGAVGNTGRSTAPHLHYEVKYDNKTENPRKFYTYDKKLEKLIYYP